MRRALRIVVLGPLWLFCTLGFPLISPIALAVGACFGTFREAWDDFWECYFWVVRGGGNIIWNGPGEDW